MTRAGAVPVADPAEVRRAGLRMLRREGRTFTALMLLNGLAAGAGLAGPWLLGIMIDKVRAGGGPGAVDRIALGIVAFALIQLGLARHARYVGHRFGERVAARLREQFVDRALALPASSIERIPVGELTARGTTDAGRVIVIMRDIAADVLIAAVQALFIIGAVLALDPLLGGVGVVGLSGIWFAVRWYLPRARSAYLAEGEANAVLAETLTATVAGARTVDAVGLAGRRIEAARQATDRGRDAMTRTLNLRSGLFPGIDISYAIPVAGVLLVGGLLLDGGRVSLGTVVAAVLYLRQLAEPLDAILVRTEQLQSSAASFARVEGLATVTGPATTAPRSEARVPADDRIEVTDVRFAYDRGRDVLHGITLAVRPGERLAVVGPSGAGKSTLGKLLAGIEVPRTGAVTVGGVPVAELPGDRLRAHVVLVTQEHHVFHDSVRDNLRLAAPDATDAELRDALAVVGATWVRDLPDGLDTRLGTSHQVRNGAQAQQLALARVVLADPHTLVLDEATAMLDPTTARRAERALASVLNGRTVVAIAHRLHTAHDADRIAVLERGRLTELGSHDELVATGGAYAALWEAWRGR